MVGEFERLLTWLRFVFFICGQAFPPFRVVEAVFSINERLELHIRHRISGDVEGVDAATAVMFGPPR